MVDSFKKVDVPDEIDDSAFLIEQLRAEIGLVAGVLNALLEIVLDL